MPKVQHTSTGNITEHVALIHKQVEKSLLDPELRQLVVKIVSGSFEWKANPRSGKQEPFIVAWGKSFVAPPELPCEPRDAECELAKVWNFVVLNVRYVYDPVTIDTFATAKETLLAGGGDCDDLDIVFEAMLNLIGFSTKARVVSINSNPNEWVHVYPLAGLPKDSPSEWVPLDSTVTGAEPGWEYPDIAKRKDFAFHG